MIDDSFRWEFVTVSGFLELSQLNFQLYCDLFD